MKYLVAALFAGVAAPALAQHTGHGAPAQPAPASEAICLPEHAAMGHCTPSASAPTPVPLAQQGVPASAPTCLPEHAAMGHCAPAVPGPRAAPIIGQPTRAADPTCLPEHVVMGHCTPAIPTRDPAPVASPTKPAGDPTCLPEHAAMGHCAPAAVAPGAAPVIVQPTTASDPNCLPEHAAMGHCTPVGAALPPAGPPPAVAFSGPEHAQDLFYNDVAAARSRRELLREHGGLTAYRIFVDEAEVAIREGREGYSFDAQAWYGGDINKLWIKTEGEGTFGGEFEGAEGQALWSRAIDPWFDAQLGVRQDFGTGPDRTYLVAGIQGLAPYWFEVEGTTFLSSKGDVTARFEAEYDLRLTQALILQPLIEFDLALQDVPELGIGSGLSTAEIGARLRYQFRPSSGPAEISPYVGIEYERAFGDTARFRRLADEDIGGWSFLVGLRTWF